MPSCLTFIALDVVHATIWGDLVGRDKQVSHGGFPATQLVPPLPVRNTMMHNIDVSST